MNGAINLELEYEGFNRMNLENLELLQKAMTAGSGVDAAAFTGGRALTLESLDNTLVNILHTQKEAVIFQVLKKMPVKSAVHQWDERSEVGADDGAWIPEGGDSEEADQTIARKYMTAKYLQTLRKVTLQAQISNMIENAMVLEQNAGTLWVIRNVEKGLIYGNSDYVSEHPDGLIKQIPASNVLDVRGADASSAAFEDAFGEACRIIRDNYGMASNLFSSTMVMEDVQKLLRDRIRFEAGKTEGAAVFDHYPTPFGNPLLKEDVFIKEGNIPSPSSLTTKRPDAPTIGLPTSPADSASEFGANDAGDYVYKVVAVNRYGDSVASAESIVTGVAAGDKVVLPVTKGTITPTAYKVYRSKKGGITGAEVRYAFTVAYTASPQDVEDYNSYLPGTSSAFILTMDQMYDALEWFQFLPLMKFDLYPTNAAVYPFLMLLFGSLALKKPVQHVRIKNISPSRLGWF
jgi:hypothetical protein